MRYGESLKGKNVVLAKCASCMGGVGVALCTIFMTLGTVGVIAIGVSQSSSMANMSSAQATSSFSIMSYVALFFSSFLGEIVLAISFALMLLGFWLSRRKIAMYSAIPGMIILFFGMYVQFSIALEIVGAILLAFAYASAYGKAVFKPRH